MDLCALGILTFLASITGLPWMCSATVQSLNHVRAMTRYSKSTNKDGRESESPSSVVETRLTGFGVHAGVLASAPRAPDRLPMRALAEGVDRSVVRAIGACLLQRARGGDPVVATAGGPPLGPAAMLDLALLRLGRIPPMRGIELVGG